MQNMQTPSSIKNSFASTKYSPQSKIKKQSEKIQQIALKTKSFIFSKNKPSKFYPKKQKAKCLDQKVLFQYKNFIPKMKNKQLLSQPKIFFSIQRKKSKVENSLPNFNDVKIQNPQMKGSKVKNEYLKMFFSRKSSFENIKQKNTLEYQRKTSFSRKLTQSSNELIEVNDIQVKQRFGRNLSFIQRNEKQKKHNKRPNLNENLSFLIRRKKDIKNRAVLNKINKSMSYMSQALENAPQ